MERNAIIQGGGYALHGPVVSQSLLFLGNNGHKTESMLTLFCAGLCQIQDPNSGKSAARKKKADKRRSGAFDADHHHSVYVHVHAVHETRREFVFLLLTKASKETHCRLDRSIRRDENALCKTNPLELRRISGPCNHARISHSKTQTTTTTRSYVSNHIT